MTDTNDPADRRLFVLDAETWDAFNAMLDAPLTPEREAALRDLLNTPTVFEGEAAEAAYAAGLDAQMFPRRKGY